MAKRDSTEQMIEESYARGRKNLELVPKIQAWCEHIVLLNQSRGMVAASGLPITVQIGCPHSSGGSMGMQLDWIAGSFILESCIGCQFHKEVFPGNFGREIIKQNEEQKQLDDARTKQKDLAKQELQNRIDDLLKSNQKNEGITELSILKLIEGLKTNDQKEINGPLILEASEMNPDFFSELSLHVLTLYYDDKIAGKYCIQATCNILKHKQIYPEFIIQLCVELLNEGINFNPISSILNHYINAQNLQQYRSSLKLIIDHLEFYRHVGEPYDLERDYDQALELLTHLTKLWPDFMQTILKEKLQINNKMDRVNVNGLLRKLIVTNSSFVFTLLPEILESLKLDDDRYMESADMATVKTIVALFKLKPEKVLKEIETKKATSSAEFEKSILPFTQRVFEDSNFVENNKDICSQLVSLTLQRLFLPSTPTDIQEEIIDDVYYLSNNNAIYLAIHFDALVGYLIKLIEKVATFLHWLNEIETKPENEWTTFNPLIGSNIWEIEGEKLRLQKNIDRIKDVITHIFETDPETHLLGVQSLIKALDSKTQEKLKKELLNIVSKSLQDELLLARFIPDLYTHLLDINSIEIRVEAMRFLDKIITKHPQLLTQTIFDLIGAFMTDHEIAIKGTTAELISSIAMYIPERLTEDQIRFFIGCFSDKHIYVHKKAIRNSNKLYPFTTREQHVNIVLDLLGYEGYYFKEKDYDFCETLIDQALRFSGGIPDLTKKIITDFMLKYCELDEYYIAKKFFEKLGEILKQRKDFESVWFKTAVKNLLNSRPDFFGDDDRAKIFTGIYKLSYNTINENAHLITDLIDSRKEDDLRDNISLLDILSYFEQYPIVLQAIKKTNDKIRRVKKTEYFFRFSETQENLAKYELSVQNGNPEVIFLKNAINETKKDES